MTAPTFASKPAKPSSASSKLPAKTPKPLKVALVCDWLTNVGGAERVLKTISDLFPRAPIYTSQYNEKKIDWFSNRDVRVGWLQIFPSSFRRFLGPLRQFYFNHLNLSDYDLIISVTGAEAKSVKFNPQTSIHLCYCHVPTQYYWGMQKDYQKNPGFGLLNPLVRLVLKLFLPPLKSADYQAAQKPTNFITISTYSAEQIKKAYNREAEIIFPPVAVQNFSASKAAPRSGYITTSRQVTWKRLDLAIKACLRLKLPLTVIGEGPEHKRLKKIVKDQNGANLINFLPLMDQKSLKRHLQTAKGYIFPSLEPFGIAPVEALAAGCPVIAYGRGGALDYVIDGENGVLFGKQSVSSLCAALKRFENLTFSEPSVSASALPFAETEFRAKLTNYIKEKLAEKQGIKPKKSVKRPALKQPAPKPKPVKQPAHPPKSTPPVKKQTPPPVKPTQPAKPLKNQPKQGNTKPLPKPTPKSTPPPKPLLKPTNSSVKINIITANDESSPTQDQEKSTPSPRPEPKPKSEQKPAQKIQIN